MANNKRCPECGELLEKRVAGVIVSNLANEYSSLPKAPTKDSWYCKVHGNIEMGEEE